MTLSQKEMQRCPLHPTRPGSTIQDEPTTTRAAGTTTGLATVQVTLRRTCTCVSFSLSLWSSAYPPLCLCSSRPSSLSASSHVRSLKEFPLWSSNRELKCAHTHTHSGSCTPTKCDHLPLFPSLSLSLSAKCSWTKMCFVCSK